MPFVKGQSGNPAGKPKGAVSPRAAIKRHFRNNPKDLEQLIQAQVDKAKDGDTVAYKALTEWIESPMPRQVDWNQITPKLAAQVLELIDNEQDGDDPEAPSDSEELQA